MNYPMMFVLMMAVPLAGCIKEPEPDLGKMVTCAFGKDAEEKESTCNTLTKTENRILDCAINRKNIGRRAACKDLSKEELLFIPKLDASRPVGTQFNLSIRKLGE